MNVQHEDVVCMIVPLHFRELGFNMVFQSPGRIH
jgi:hypothetical protein